MSFSERYGYKAPRKELQVNSVDNDLRNSIWNATNELLQTNTQLIYSRLIVDFFKVPLQINHEIFPDYNRENEKFREHIHRLFDTLEWNEIYDFIEFLINLPELNKKSKYHDYRDILKIYLAKINGYLERESSAFRVVGRIILRTINDVEISSIEKSLNIKESKFSLVEHHISESLGLLSDRKNPNFRNSIKESISAVEACLRIITGESTLGKALNNLEKSGIQIEGQLRSGFEKIYAYTNSKSTGIRHALIEKSVQPDYDDAMFMLVSCSAFVNFLIAKNTIKA